MYDKRANSSLCLPRPFFYLICNEERRSFESPSVANLYLWFAFRKVLILVWNARGSRIRCFERRRLRSGRKWLSDVHLENPRL